VVEAMGIPLDVPPSRQADVLRRARIAFLFAPAHHPALRHAAQARRELGVRTIFNALGPLANPARATHQLVGVYDDALRPVAARALGALGVKRAWVVRSADGLDELSPAGPTRVSELTADGAVREREVAPEDFGLARTGLDALAGGDAKQNAAALEALLGGALHPARTAVVLNAAAALAVVMGDDLRACAQRAEGLLADGSAHATLAAWRLAARAARDAATEAPARREPLACSRRSWRPSAPSSRRSAPRPRRLGRRSMSRAPCDAPRARRSASSPR